MARIVWLASYPKSGNTWVRFMLGSLILGRVNASAEIGHQIPDIHYGILGQHLYGNHVCIVKTHWKYWPGLPLREDTAGVIYIVRHPVDVLESCQNFAMLRSGDLRRKLNPEDLALRAANWVDQYIAHGGHPKFLQSGVGTWVEHVQSWTSTQLNWPKLVLRYEDLMLDPAAQLRRIVRFLNLKKSDAEIAAAAAAASRENMKIIEEREIAEKQEGLFYQARNRGSIEAGQRFVGRSVEGSSQFVLSPDQRERAALKFSALLSQFGYQ